MPISNQEELTLRANMKPIVKEAKSKTIHDFIRENKAQIDAAIRKALNNPRFSLNDSERRLWILNDEGLYTWARSEGVNI